MLEYTREALSVDESRHVSREGRNALRGGTIRPYQMAFLVILLSWMRGACVGGFTIPKIAMSNNVVGSSRHRV